ncbi:MAG TPA: hypothetical protein VHP11_09775, partial [Tepidisphaeraceae bacterium]|nr:hypothetical protein [Tepidisphaeraceae bacterium]
TPVRFACPACSQSIRPNSARLLVGPVVFEQVMAVLRTDSCAARWLENGQVWLLYYRTKQDCNVDKPRKTLRNQASSGRMVQA